MRKTGRLGNTVTNISSKSGMNLAEDIKIMVLTEVCENERPGTQMNNSTQKNGKVQTVSMRVASL